MKKTKPFPHATFLAACVAVMLIDGALSYVPWPLNFALVLVPVVALLTYLFWPWRMSW